MKRVAILFVLLVSGSAFCQQPAAIGKNIVCGMVDGAAFLMDVYTPFGSNQKGIIIIPGNAYGYTYAGAYNDGRLKDEYYLGTGYTGKWARMLVGQGVHRFYCQPPYYPQVSLCPDVRGLQAKAMYEKLVSEHVPAEIFLSKGTRHMPLPDMGEVDNWFKRYL